MTTKALVWMNVAPYGLSVTGDKDLPVSYDQKVMALLLPVEKCPIDFFHRVAFTAQI